ncbi:MAG: radical SAM protein [Anaerorhabdus sp.]
MKGLLIETQDYGKYFYNDETGLILKHNILLENLIKNTNLLNSQEELRKFEDELGKYEFQRTINFYNQFNKKYVNEFKFEKTNSIKEMVEILGFKQLIFKMTDQCNMRCKYCVYSDYYPFSESYTDDYINIEVAKKALDYYMDNFIRIYNLYNNSKPKITFYGGEPLLNFKTIKEIINYYNETYSEYTPEILMTTNGLLLKDKETREFLIKNNVDICLSLDGYMENHDRNRVLADGGKTYSQILDILNDYFLDYDRIYFLACYDYKTDMIKMKDFFQDISKKKKYLIRASQIDESSESYYQQFNEEDIVAFVDKYKKLQTETIDAICKNEEISFLGKSLYAENLLRLKDRGKFNYSSPIFSSFSESCIPGNKLYVDSRGKFHICEKINGHFPIGDVDNGIDYELVAEIIKKYNVAIAKCKKCNISRLCGNCFANMAYSDTFNEIKEDECDVRRKIYSKIFEDLIKIEIQNPNFFNSVMKKINKTIYE